MEIKMRVFFRQIFVRRVHAVAEEELKCVSKRRM